MLRRSSDKTKTEKYWGYTVWELSCNVYNQNNLKTRTHIKKNKNMLQTSEATQARWPRHSLPTTRARSRTAAEPENRCGQHSEAKTKQEK